MKRNDIKQLASADSKELTSRVAELRAKISSLRFDKAIGKVKNPREIISLRKDVARILTIQNKAKIEAQNAK